MRVVPLDLDDAATAQRVWTLQRVAYVVEAALLGDDRIPPLHEDVPALVASGLHWLGAVDGDALAGAVAFTEDAAVVDVHRLVVDPERHRRGTGRLLVREVLARTSAPQVVVSTGRDNLPACRLYASLGMTEAGDVEEVPGLWVRRWELRR